MKLKYIEKMYKWNKRKLSDKQIKIGNKRLSLLKDFIKTETTWIEREQRWHCLMWVYNKKPFKCAIIARKSKQKNHALIKCALAAPIKAWNLGG